jgi:hypothetical protein
VLIGLINPKRLSYTLTNAGAACRCRVVAANDSVLQTPPESWPDNLWDETYQPQQLLLGSFTVSPAVFTLEATKSITFTVSFNPSSPSKHQHSIVLLFDNSEVRAGPSTTVPMFTSVVIHLMTLSIACNILIL